MYNSNHNHNNRNSFSRNFSGRNRKASKIDPTLFVNKAIDTDNQAQYNPKYKFEDFEICDKLKRNILDKGYTIPTPIQDQAIPHILSGRDLIGIASTGSGKTAAFLITLINKAYLDRNQRILIVVPTRELAVQIYDEFKTFAKGCDLDAVATIGGANINRQTQALRHSPHFVIGTPGRLKDLIQKRALNLSLFQNIVLDEVDRMLDIGFIHDIKYLVSYLSKKRQSLFFSATVDRRTEEIMNSFVTNPITVSVKKTDSNTNINQDIVKISNGSQKIDILHDLLIKPEFEKVIVFGRTKWGMEKLSKALVMRGFRTAAIHGNKSQSQRERAIFDFKSNRFNILIATDVASRGLDIDDVTHVINYDVPATYDDYIHRIGRTGRAGKKGTALTFIE